LVAYLAWRELQGDREETIGKGGKRAVAEDNIGLMPFAVWCPAGGTDTMGFGFKMVGPLVAVLCAEIDETWKLDGYESLLDGAQPLSSERHEYGDLMLKRP
jgi:hypothetical protein